MTSAAGGLGVDVGSECGQFRLAAQVSTLPTRLLCGFKASNLTNLSEPVTPH